MTSPGSEFPDTMDCEWSVHPGQLLDRSWTAPVGPVQVWELGDWLDIWWAWGTRPGRPDGAQTPCIFLDATPQQQQFFQHYGILDTHPAQTDSKTVGIK